ncbi:coiled-coil domain-containing protein 40-like [Daktulosphaira vitifoliae]|uniref:coiled-coil domain-containing protein 40-like n=1 Tax=Daktulosphaira vitifoliae TaxID=58002 RepID=UPI0021AA029A|nr:coiled-coil domain-containing protein 40-like [Daktulosphaira vitifoliae]
MGTVKNDQLMVLEPNNPIMIRFQKALNQHLLKQKLNLEQEILSLKGNVKTNQDNKLLLENKINVLVRQNEAHKVTLDTLHKLKIEIKMAKEQVDNHIDKGKQRFLDVDRKITEQNKNILDLKRQLDSSRTLFNELLKYEKDQETTFILCNQKESHIKHHKKKILNEQQNQNLLLLSLTQEIIHLEDRIKELGEQAETKFNERQILNQRVMDSSIDLDTINTDNTKIALLWKGVLTSIQQSDKTFHKIKNDLQEAKNQNLILIMEANSYKKSSQNEFKKNEDLISNLNKLKQEQINMQQNYNNHTNQLNNLSDEHSKLLQMLEFQSQNLSELLSEQKSLQNEINVLVNSLELKSKKKLKIEDEIVHDLKKQMLTNNSCININNKISEIKTQNKKHELMLIQTENNLSQTLLKAEQYRIVILNLERDIEENTKTMKEKSNLIFDLETELNKLLCDIQQKSRQIDIETKNLETVRKKQDEGNLKTPQAQIVQVKKKLEDINNNIDFLKETWIKKQNNNVQMTQQRNELMNKINKLKKYNIVADAKNFKLKQEIISLSKGIDHYKRNFTHLRNAILKYSQNISNTKGKTNFLSIENEWLQNKSVVELKENERECLEYADQLKSIKNELDETQNKYIKKQQELITWEVKIKQIIEMKKEIVNKEGDIGDIDAMKNEIHRMQIRESQLKKTLKKIMFDLEGCISKRETIYNTVAAKESRIKGKSETKQRLFKKINDLRLSIQKSKIECKNVEINVNIIQKEKDELESQYYTLSQELSQIKKNFGDIIQEFENANGIKIRNIEHLSHKQSYARHLDSVKQGKYSLLIKDEFRIDEESSAAWKKNQDILCVVEALKNDFPNLDDKFLRIINILSIVIK